MEIIVVDLETSIKCPVGTNKANPMWLGNSIVAEGYGYIRGESFTYSGLYKSKKAVTGASFKEDQYVIGHNIKFDMLYCYRSTPTKHLLPRIWDTQLAEYILTAQQSKYASLDALTEKYIGEEEVKDERLKEMWKSGVDTEDIPEDVLMPYLKKDVMNTAAIFEKQWRIAQEQGQLPLILTQMEALRATIAMALSGMAVDWEYINENISKYHLLIEHLKGELFEIAPHLDFASPKQLSNYFFGGTEIVKVKEEVGHYKNGNVKYKVRADEVPIMGLLHADKLGLTLSKAGYYPTDTDVLHLITEKGTPLSANVAATVLKLRSYSKIKDTYYQGIKDLRFPSDFIYPNLSHVSTSTGRLSANQPNLQNQTDIGGIKKCFISGYHLGSLVEVDYSQLEVVWLAYLSGDRQLISDINNDVDIHTALYTEMYGRAPTKDERKAFKPRTFQLIYGAGAKAIAEQGKIPIEEARKFIRVFYTRYNGVKEYHDSLLPQAKMAAVITYKEDVSGPFHTYLKRMPWGRHYMFHTYANEWSKERTFSPTELKNYPVQGSATGDMVPLMLGVLQRELEKEGYYQNSTARLVMTVHDSVLLDVHPDVLYNVMDLVKRVMESATDELKEQLNISFPCKLKVGVSYGPNWQEMSDYVKE
jgi:DNA polymerase-1